MHFIKIKNVKQLEHFSINILGQLKNMITGHMYYPRLANGYWIVFPKLTTGKHKQFMVSRLLAFCFLHPPSPIYEDICSSYIVSFRDNDPENINIGNLYWNTLANRSKQLWDEKVSKSFEKYPFLESIDYYYPSPVECSGKPGWYLFPYKYSRRAINKEGQIYDLVNDKIIQPRLLNTGYLYTSHFINSDTYSGSLIHRIIGMLFVEKPSKYEDMTYDQLHINHKNGIKIDNNPENLEWCINQDNIEHYYEVLTNNTNRYEVLQKNVITGYVKIFSSIYSASKETFLSRVSLRNHLLSYQAGSIVINNYVYKFNDGKDWPLVLNSDEVEYRIHPNLIPRIGCTYDVIAENVVDNIIYIFTSMTEACIILGLNPASAENHRISKGSNVPFKNWVFYPMADDFISEALEKRQVRLELKVLKDDNSI